MKAQLEVERANLGALQRTLSESEYYPTCQHLGCHLLHYCPIFFKKREKFLVPLAGPKYAQGLCGILAAPNFSAGRSLYK
jgi:hypothetical protein